MYDNFFEPCKYMKLLKIVGEIDKGINTTVSETDVQYMIEEAYSNGELTDHQYDTLIGMI